MPANTSPGISVRGGRVYCAHGYLAAKWESTTNNHPHMLFWTCVDCNCGAKGWCACGYLWNKDLVRALEEVPCGEGKELAAYVKSLPGGRQDYTPFSLTPAIEALVVTMIRCRDWTKDEQHHKAIFRYLRPTTPPPDSSQGKRKREVESSGSQSPRPVIKKVKIEDEDTPRVGLLSVKNESDNDNAVGISRKMRQLSQV